jgi:hypothetical protein
MLRKSINTDDGFKWPIFAETQITKINRVCLKCWAHWFGVDGDVKKFTSKEWESYINQSLKD